MYHPIYKTMSKMLNFGKALSNYPNLLLNMLRYCCQVEVLLLDSFSFLTMTHEQKNIRLKLGLIDFCCALGKAFHNKFLNEVTLRPHNGESA